MSIKQPSRWWFRKIESSEEAFKVIRNTSICSAICSAIYIGLGLLMLFSSRKLMEFGFGAMIVGFIYGVLTVLIYFLKSRVVAILFLILSILNIPSSGGSKSVYIIWILMGIRFIQATFRINKSIMPAEEVEDSLTLTAFSYPGEKDNSTAVPAEVINETKSQPEMPDERNGQQSTRSTRVIISVIFGSLITILIAGGVLLFSGAPASTPSNLTELARQIQPSVVLISTSDQAGKPLATGTGFFVSATGEIATNRHVMEGAAKATITTAAGKEYDIGGIIAEDQVGDIVKLTVTVPREVAVPVTLTTDPPAVGEKVLVIGNPLGLEQTVSDGIVSAVRDIPTFGGVIIQITAPISPGSSGSPVVNMRGEVIGIATMMILEGQNLNFAIPGARLAALTTGPNRGFSIAKSAEQVEKEARAREQSYAKFAEAVEQEKREARAREIIERENERIEQSNTPPPIPRRVSCSSCAGRGIVQCNACRGTGVGVKCSHCGGSGRLACITCDGTGQRNCAVCNGSGRTSGYIAAGPFESCSYCQGTGKIKCSSCNGGGTRQCVFCEGKGTDNCIICGGRGQSRCSSCGGTGTILQ